MIWTARLVDENEIKMIRGQNFELEFWPFLYFDGDKNLWDYCLSRTRGKEKSIRCYIDIYNISVQYKDISPKALCAYYAQRYEKTGG